MHEKIGLYEAKAKLSEILRRVESGESFTIVNRGKPVADIIPSHNSKKEAAISNILNSRKHKVPTCDLGELKGSGRK